MVGTRKGGCVFAAQVAGYLLDHTNSWKPSLDRRQSWSKEDQKHARFPSLATRIVDTGESCFGWERRRGWILAACEGE